MNLSTPLRALLSLALQLVPTPVRLRRFAVFAWHSAMHSGPRDRWEFNELGRPYIEKRCSCGACFGRRDPREYV